MRYSKERVNVPANVVAFRVSPLAVDASFTCRYCNEEVRGSMLVTVNEQNARVCPLCRDLHISYLFHVAGVEEPEACEFCDVYVSQGDKFWPHDEECRIHSFFRDRDFEDAPEGEGCPYCGVAHA